MLLLMMKLMKLMNLMKLMELMKMMMMMILGIVAQAHISLRNTMKNVNFNPTHERKNMDGKCILRYSETDFV